MNDPNFYADIVPFTTFSNVCDPSLYVEAPPGWDAVITDVQGSTLAIEAGRYKDVNALGVCSIIAALNALNHANVPYVFGGDGATLLTPSTSRASLETALANVQKIAQDSLNLTLRVGIVPISVLHEANQSVRVAKYQASPHVQLAMFSGGGLTLAEKLIKNPATASTYAIKTPQPATADTSILDGFECRWNPLTSRHGHIVSALIMARKGADVYTHILSFLDTLQAQTPLQPVSAENLQLATDPASFRTESLLRGGPPKSFRSRLYQYKIRFITGVGRRLIRSGRALGDFDGASYPAEVTSNTDFRKFDDTLRMVLDMSDAQAEAFRVLLTDLHKDGSIFFGLHFSQAALMTCMVRNHRGHHIHFIDGADGGYAFAAKHLKQQIAAAAPQPKPPE